MSLNQGMDSAGCFTAFCLLAILREYLHIIISTAVWCMFVLVGRGEGELNRNKIVLTL